MTQIEVNQDGFVVDASVIAAAFQLAPEEVQPLMRCGDVTSKCETGVGEDAGRSRLTFHYRDRALRLVVDQAGTVLKQSSFPVQTRASIAADMFPIPENKGAKDSS